MLCDKIAKLFSSLYSNLAVIMTFPFPAFCPGKASNFPTIAATVETSGLLLAGSRTITLPSGISNGDLCLVFTRGITTDLASIPAGWTSGYFRLGPGGATSGRCIWRKCDGSEGTSLSVTITGAGTGVRCVAVRIAGSSGSPEFASTTVASAISVDPPNLSPTFGSRKTLWFAAYVMSTYVSGYPPTNYTDVISNATLSLRVASRNLQAASEDPPAITQALGDYVAGTVAIKG